MPKHVNKTLLPASSDEVPRGGAPTTQLIRVENTMHGAKGLSLRVKVSYKLPSGEAASATWDEKRFPATY